MPIGDESRLAQPTNRAFKQGFIQKAPTRQQDALFADALRHVDYHLYKCNMKFMAYHRFGDVGVYIRHERCE